LNDKFVCIHGHFYQPPRDNPWLEYVEQQDSAYPHHDWNARITMECYAPNAASRILDKDGGIIDIVNNYSQISFNFGPTLLSWLERHSPGVYEAILEADRMSMQRFSGHGSAIAQVYNHMIMPLANKRDKYTQVVWGIRDFEKRFKRFPEGMWLPETAVDIETLEILADCGIAFTILAPHQAKRVRRLGRGGRWQDVTGGDVNPTIPYICKLPSGRSMNLFFYDGPISQAIAFEGLLSNGEYFAKRLTGTFSEDVTDPQLVHIATDGETYGHHHRYGEMALAYCLYYINDKTPVQTTIYGEFLEKFPPIYEVEIYENTSWSCVHGIGRWKENCGCHSGMHHGWTQEWRTPLRDALNYLREEMIPFFEKNMSQYVEDPWNLRNDYINVIINRDTDFVNEFITTKSKRDLSQKEKQRFLKLLELQRNAMLMYTSCGWFFDEISGIEATQVQMYAERLMQIAEDLGSKDSFENFVRFLEKAPSNIFPNARIPYEKYIKPARVDLLRVGAHYAISSLFEKYPETAEIYCYKVNIGSTERYDAGKLKAATGRAKIISDLTWNDREIEYAVIHLGDHNIYGGVKDYSGDGDFSGMQAEIKAAFEKVDIPEFIRVTEKYFKTHSYSLWHLFKDDQRKILDKSQILTLPLQTAETFYRQVFENNYTTLNYLRGLHIPIPKPLSIAIEYTINLDLKSLFDTDVMDIDKLRSLMEEANKWKIDIDGEMLSFIVNAWLENKMSLFKAHPEDIAVLSLLESVLSVLNSAAVGWDYWKLQNDYFSIGRQLCADMNRKKSEGDELAAQWTELFVKVGAHLGVKLEC
jgi:alpha-amylase/alpha-mannosidase (GH57 family)